jgi:hypothetical protein
MPHRSQELSGRELVRGATLGLPLRGLSCPGRQYRDSEPPLDGSFQLSEPNRRGASDGMSAAADHRPGCVADSHEVLTTGARKPSPSARPRVRERILAAMLGLALAAVLAHAARRSTAIDNHIGRRSR